MNKDKEFENILLSNLLEEADTLFIETKNQNLKAIAPFSKNLLEIYLAFKPTIYSTKRKTIEKDFLKIIRIEERIYKKFLKIKHLVRGKKK